MDLGGLVGAVRRDGLEATAQRLGVSGRWLEVVMGTDAAREVICAHGEGEEENGPN